MKKIVSVLLAVVCFVSLFAMPMTVSADRLSKAFSSVLSTLETYYEYNASYMAQRVAKVFLLEQGRSSVPVAEFEAMLNEYFLIDDARLQEIRSLDRGYAIYNAETQTYELHNYWGAGGRTPHSAYGGYVRKGDTYEVYYQKITRKYIDSVYDEEMPLEEYMELYGKKNERGYVYEFEYKGETYYLDGENGFCVKTYLPEGNKYTVEMNGDIVRILSCEAYEGLPAAFDDDTYPDVAEGTWYYDAVKFVSKMNYMTGYASGRFGPADRIQRQDFVVMLARMCGADLQSYEGQTGGLSDVGPNSYYASAVAWAVDKGYITGYQNGAFGVGDPMNREQVATILYRYKQSPAVDNAEAILSAFPDADSISAFAKDAMAWANQEGLIKGMANGNMAPRGIASRAQIATIIQRMNVA